MVKHVSRLGWSPHCPDCYSPALFAQGPYSSDELLLKCPDYTCGYEGPDSVGTNELEDRGERSRIPWGTRMLAGGLCNHAHWHEQHFDTPLKGLMIREYLEDAVNAGCTLSLKETTSHRRLLQWSVEGSPAPSPERFWCKYHLSAEFVGVRRNRRYSTEEEAIEAYRVLPKPSRAFIGGESYTEGLVMIRCAYCTGFHVIPLSGLEAMRVLRQKEQGVYEPSYGLCSVRTYHSEFTFVCNGNPGTVDRSDETRRNRAKKESQKLQEKVKKFQPHWGLYTGLVPFVLCRRCSNELNVPYARFQREQGRIRKQRESERTRNTRGIGRWFEEFDKHHGGDGSGDVWDDDEMDEF